MKPETTEILDLGADGTAATPLISVIIPVWNRADRVAEAAGSVLAQKGASFELILVDDASDDATPDVLAAFRERRPDLVRVLQLPENRGVSAARNRGIRAAKGELIAFLDSDDLWLPGKLAVQARWFAENPDMLICQTEELWVRNGVRVNPGKRHRKRDGDIFIPSLELCLVSPSAVMMRRELFDTAGLFDESLPACEDYDLWLRTSLHHPVGLIDEPYIVKRGGHADQLSARPGLDAFRIRVLVRLLEGGDLSAERRAAAIRVLEKKCRVYADGCEKRGRSEEAAAVRRAAAAFADEEIA